MAFDYSQKYEKKLRPFHRTYLKVRSRLHKFIELERSFARAVLPKPRKPSSLPNDSQFISSNFDSAGSTFQKQDYVFIDGLFNESFHKALVETWPSKRFLEPHIDIFKSYDVGFRWQWRKNRPPNFIEFYPAFQALLQMFRSPEFETRAAQFCGSSEPVTLECFSINSTIAGSIVAPHRDTIAQMKLAKPSFNLIMFVNGSGGDQSGGLCISEDNLYKNVLFEPKKLFNTALVYNSQAKFFHGFPPVKLGKFRWAMAAHFCAEKFVSQGLSKQAA